MLENREVGIAASAFNRKRASIFKKITGGKRAELAWDVYKRVIANCEKNRRHVITPFLNEFQFRSHPYEMLNKNSLIKIGSSYPDLCMAFIEATEEVLNDWVERTKNE